MADQMDDVQKIIADSRSSGKLLRPKDLVAAIRQDAAREGHPPPVTWTDGQVIRGAAKSRPELGLDNLQYDLSEQAPAGPAPIISASGQGNHPSSAGDDLAQQVRRGITEGVGNVEDWAVNAAHLPADVLNRILPSSWSRAMGFAPGSSDPNNVLEMARRGAAMEHAKAAAIPAPTTPGGQIANVVPEAVLAAVPYMSLGGGERAISEAGEAIPWAQRLGRNIVSGVTSSAPRMAAVEAIRAEPKGAKAMLQAGAEGAAVGSLFPAAGGIASQLPGVSRLPAVAQRFIGVAAPTAAMSSGSPAERAAQSITYGLMGAAGEADTKTKGAKPKPAGAAEVKPDAAAAPAEATPSTAAPPAEAKPAPTAEVPKLSANAQKALALARRDAARNPKIKILPKHFKPLGISDKAAEDAWNELRLSEPQHLDPDGHLISPPEAPVAPAPAETPAPSAKPAVTPPASAQYPGGPQGVPPIHPSETPWIFDPRRAPEAPAAPAPSAKPAVASPAASPASATPPAAPETLPPVAAPPPAPVYAGRSSTPPPEAPPTPPVVGTAPRANNRAARRASIAPPETSAEEMAAEEMAQSKIGKPFRELTPAAQDQIRLLVRRGNTATPTAAPPAAAAPPEALTVSAGRSAEPIEYRWRETPDAMFAEAFQGGNPVAGATFTRGPNNILLAQNVHVDAALQRQGIATRLYDMAVEHSQQATGVAPDIRSATLQSREGAAFRQAYDARRAAVAPTPPAEEVIQPNVTAQPPAGPEGAGAVPEDVRRAQESIRSAFGKVVGGESRRGSWSNRPTQPRPEQIPESAWEDPGFWANLDTIARYHLGRVGQDFQAWKSAMIERLGDWVEQIAGTLWQRVTPSEVPVTPPGFPPMESRVGAGSRPGAAEVPPEAAPTAGTALPPSPPPPADWVARHAGPEAPPPPPPPPPGSASWPEWVRARLAEGMPQEEIERREMIAQGIDPATRKPMPQGMTGPPATSFPPAPPVWPPTTESVIGGESMYPPGAEIQPTGYRTPSGFYTEADAPRWSWAQAHGGRGESPSFYGAAPRPSPSEAWRSAYEETPPEEPGAPHGNPLHPPMFQPPQARPAPAAAPGSGGEAIQRAMVESGVVAPVMSADDVLSRAGFVERQNVTRNVSLPKKELAWSHQMAAAASAETGEDVPMVAQTSVPSKVVLRQLPSGARATNASLKPVADGQLEVQRNKRTGEFIISKSFRDGTTRLIAHGVGDYDLNQQVTAAMQNESPVTAGQQGTAPPPGGMRSTRVVGSPAEIPAAPYRYTTARAPRVQPTSFPAPSGMLPAEAPFRVPNIGQYEPLGPEGRGGVRYRFTPEKPIWDKSIAGRWVQKQPPPREGTMTLEAFNRLRGNAEPVAAAAVPKPTPAPVSAQHSLSTAEIKQVPKGEPERTESPSSPRKSFKPEDDLTYTVRETPGTTKTGGSWMIDGEGGKETKVYIKKIPRKAPYEVHLVTEEGKDLRMGAPHDFDAAKERAIAVARQQDASKLEGWKRPGPGRPKGSKKTSPAPAAADETDTGM